MRRHTALTIFIFTIRSTAMSRSLYLNSEFYRHALHSIRAYNVMSDAASK